MRHRPGHRAAPAREEGPDRLLGGALEQLGGAADGLVERIGPGQRLKIGVDPFARTSSAPGPIEPARASVGQPSDRASRATPTAVLPKALEPSIAPSAGQAEVGPSEPIGQADGLDHQRDARPERPAGERHQARPQAPRRARAGQVGDVDAEVARGRSGRSGRGCGRASRPDPGVAPFWGP